jgi:hypothetical protein
MHVAVAVDEHVGIRALAALVLRSHAAAAFDLEASIA